MRLRIPVQIRFAAVFEAFAAEVHKTAKDKGWWDEPRDDAACIALMHAELSEALEVLREDPDMEDKDIDALALEAELADVIIRIMDYAQARGLNVGAAIERKAEFNKTRPRKHGKRF